MTGFGQSNALRVAVTSAARRSRQATGPRIVQHDGQAVGGGDAEREPGAGRGQPIGVARESTPLDLDHVGAVHLARERGLTDQAAGSQEVP